MAYIYKNGKIYSGGGGGSGDGTFTDMDSQELEDFIDEIDGQGANLADYVVEQGIDNSWTYRKWNSGIYEAWQYYQATGLNCTNSNAGTYYGGQAFLPLPNFVLTVSGCTYGNTPSQSSGVYIYSTVRNGEDLEVNYRAHTSSSNSSCGGFFHLFGTWK